MIKDLSKNHPDDIMEYINQMPYQEQVLYFRSSGVTVNNRQNCLAGEAERCPVILELKNFVMKKHEAKTHSLTSRKVGNCFEYFIERRR